MKNFKKNRFNYFLKLLGEFTIKISQTIFNVSVLTFIIYVALENFKTGLVSNYFDLNTLLVLAIASGLFIILLKEKDHHETKRKNYLFFLVFAILVALFTYPYLQSLGKIGFLSTILIGLALFIILNLFASYKIYD